MTNPFDDEAGEFYVLVNEERQFALWPTFRDIPAGWRAAGPRGTRQQCLQYVEAHWTDMRPQRLVQQME
jgi:MbtH protein